MAASSGEVESFIDSMYEREFNSENTRDAYIRWISRFEMWRGDKSYGEQTLREWDTTLGDGSITDYPWKNRRGPPAPAEYAYRSRVQSLSATKLWTVKKHEASVDTEVQNIAKGEPEPFNPTVLSKQEVNAVMAAADDACTNPGCEAAVRLGYDAILRGAELAAVRTEDLNLGQGTLYVRAVKGSNNVTVGLDGQTTRALREFLSDKDRDRVFHNAYGRAWEPASWNQHFRRKHHQAGFHAFARHSAITHRLEDGEPFGQVYRRARHANPSMTTKYAKIVGVDSPGWAGADEEPEPAD